MQICPKCTYTRKPTDTNPDWQCPACSVAYNKVGTTAFAQKDRRTLKIRTTKKASGIFPGFFTLRRIIIAAIAIMILRMLFHSSTPWSYRDNKISHEFDRGVHIGEPVIRVFDVSGTSVPELDQAMLQSGPLDSLTQTRRWGMCQWNITWKFSYAEDHRQCRIDAFSLNLVGAIDLPQWVNRSSGSEALKTKWDSFALALRRHEFGHWNHGIAAVNNLESRLNTITPQRDCETLNREISAIGAQVISEYGEVEKDYDKFTNHGINQGATLY